MRFLVISALLLSLCGSVLAQYKCTGAGGTISFQQVPCAAGAKSEKLTVRAAEPSRETSAVATPSTGSAEVRILKTMERDRKIRELSDQITGLEGAIAARGGQMSAEMEALRSQKSRAMNNLAGATWEQSISTEMTAVAQKYKAMNDADLARLPVLRTELSRLQASPK